MEPDEKFKGLIKELGAAINESLGESEKIAEVLSRIKAAGYDLFIVLEVTVGYNKRGTPALLHRQRFTPEERPTGELHLTSQDAEFLKALKITAEDGSE